MSPRRADFGVESGVAPIGRTTLVYSSGCVALGHGPCWRKTAGESSGAWSCDGGSRSRFHLGRARRRYRWPQGWCPRLPPAAVESGEKPSDRSRGRVSWTGGALQRSVLARSLRVSSGRVSWTGGALQWSVLACPLRRSMHGSSGHGVLPEHRRHKTDRPESSEYATRSQERLAPDDIYPRVTRHMLRRAP